MATSATGTARGDDKRDPVSSGMRLKGLEPSRACAHQALNLACLPISPQPRRTTDSAIAGSREDDGVPAPLISALTAVHDEDHVITVFRWRGLWGAIGTSKFTGLRNREPVYRTLRELAMSYFEHYFNLEGERTLRGYGRPVNLTRFDRLHWMTAEADLWPIAEHLKRIPHVALVPTSAARRLTRVNGRLWVGDLLEHPTAGKRPHR